MAAKVNMPILVMKPFGSATLVSYNKRQGRNIEPSEDPEYAPEIFTVEECLRFVLSLPGVVCPIPGMQSLDELKQNVAIAATFKPLSQNEHKKLVERGNRYAGGMCGLCKEKPCEDVCPNHVPISFLLSSGQLLRRTMGWEARRIGDIYGGLNHDYLDCDGCGECEKVCPNKFNICKNIQNAHQRLCENRAFNTIRGHLLD